MIIVLILLIAFVCYLTVKKYNNIYSMAFATALVAIVVLIVATTIYINTKSLYTYMFYFEQLFFGALMNFPVQIYDIRNIAFLSLALYITAMHIYILKTDNRRIKQRVAVYVMVIAIILTANNSSVVEYMYISCFGTKSKIVRELLRIVYSAINYFNISVLLYYTLMPYILSYTQFVKSRSIYIRRRILFAGLILMFIQILYNMIAFMCPIYFFFTGFHIESVANIGTISNENIYDRFFFIYTIIMIVTSLYVIIKFRIFDEILFGKRRIKQQTKFNFDDIRHIFHSCKNTVNVMEKLNSESLDSYTNIELVKKNLLDERECIYYLFTHFNSFLNSFKKEPMTYLSVSLGSISNGALKRLIKPDNIDVVTDYTTEYCDIYADEYAITEAISNVIQNAYEAIGNKNKGNVTISTWSESGFACISIRDNGCGIEKRDIKHVFKSLFTTKKTYENWGMGLSYTKKVVTTHSGFIDVQSQVGIGTEFQIILPLD